MKPEAAEELEPSDDDTLEQMRGDGDDRILVATCDLRPYGDETSS